MKAPHAVYRDGACNGPLARAGRFLVYRKGDEVQPEHEADVKALAKGRGDDGVGDSD